MKPIKTPILITTLYLMIHSIAPQLGIPDVVIIASWALSPLLVIWLVVRVLKDGIESKQTFDEHFYEDVKSVRVKAEATNPNLKD
ncbi:MAG: hypothetical protein ACPGLV_08695 [Bacteroidia bacterium]